MVHFLKKFYMKCNKTKKESSYRYINKKIKKVMKTTTKTISKLLLLLGLILVINTSFLAYNTNNIMTIETEESLVLEDWMMNENYFSTPIIEEEKTLELENWMLDEKYFQ